MSTPLVNAIAEATEGDWPEELVDLAAPINLNRARVAAAACIAVVAALPADYTGTDILCYLRGEDVPSEPLPALRFHTQVTTQGAAGVPGAVYPFGGGVA